VAHALSQVNDTVLSCGHQ